MSHKERDKSRQGTKLYRASTDNIGSRLVSVASGLGGGSLGVGNDDPLLVNSLEERLDNGTISDLSTLAE